MSTFTVMSDERRNTSESDQYLSIGEVAKSFGVTVATVRNWDRAGRIASIRTPGGQRRFRRSDVVAALQAPTPATP